MNDPVLSALAARWEARENAAELKTEIQNAVVARRSQRGGHRDWALLCEQVGLWSLAFSEFQLALRDDPEDQRAAYHLAQHYRERGDVRRALSLLERLLATNPAQRPWLDTFVEILIEDDAQPRAEQAIVRAEQHGLPPSEAAELRASLVRQSVAAAVPTTPQEPVTCDSIPSDADCVRFCSLFSGQEGVYARQWVRRDGETGYSPVHEPFTPAVARNHLLGSYTIGIYPVRLDNTATFFALDLDIDRTALQRAHGDHLYAQSLRDTLRSEGPRLLAALRELGFQPLFENSGYKGRHYWVFLDQPETADTLHLFGRLLIAWQAPHLAPGLHLEFFPKQPRLKGRNLGNLIKLPLGIHRRTGHRSRLLDDQGQPLADPFSALSAVSRASREILVAAIQRLKTLTQGMPSAFPTPPWEDESAPAAPAAPPVPPPGPPPPTPPPVWTEADFHTDPRVRHLLAHCPTLAALKAQVDECQRLSHEEQLVLIHSLGHLEGGPQAVNYLFARCVDVGPEKYMKDRLKGSPVSCPSIRKKIPHITRRVACRCAFEFAADRYPSPVLHLLTLPADLPVPTPNSVAPGLVQCAQRYAVLERRRAEILAECEQLRETLVQALRSLPDHAVPCPGGAYRLIVREGVEELVWQPDPDGEPDAKPQPPSQPDPCEPSP